MSHCRYDRTAEAYLTPDGEPCTHDDYGDPTVHCTARRSCSWHVGTGELTCARCIGRARTTLRRIVDLSALMHTQALADGVDSEAANLAGPGADPEAWTWRKISARQGRAWHVSLVEDDDEHHPYLVLGRWDLMIREDYDHPSDVPVTIANAADYLERQLGRIAQDDGQDFTLFAAELKRCRQHLEAVLHNDDRPDRGAPCPACIEESGKGPRLTRSWGHWCDDTDCARLHFADTTEDVWRCPANTAHSWGEEDYRLRVADVYADTTRPAETTDDEVATAGVSSP